MCVGVSVWLGWSGIRIAVNMIRTLIYPSSGACDYSVELPHWSYCSWFDVCWGFGVVGLEWYPYCSQHDSDINISIIRSLRLFSWITTLVYCSWFDVCWSFGVVGLEWYPCCRLQPATRLPRIPRTKNNRTNVVIQQNSRKLLMMDILIYETRWAHKKWKKTASDIRLVFYSIVIH